ncbi:polysaccharide pyruvyl transferase CsaB [Myxacorys almedinensis]|uniref:Polysaccharide pyruvyl transferase CsaB n=1 Tax=Myxacorys almedinensis A TaxID=2690445 RepID=A0A8J7YWW1_9CYAN|nr:polysaccharide pyruvyl transferase CsaB [Myxacorys almedinensis]NDJ16094.1 polysaccharide pyruvyl transferase CsaB [Myxacorys almedinensis A]
MRAVLCGYYGMGNGGDEALLASLLQLLPPGIEPIVLSGSPHQTRDRYRVECCDRKSFKAVFRALRTSDLFIWGGGSLIQDATSALSPMYYMGLMALAQMMGLKTIAWAQGIGPIRRSFNRWSAKQVFRNCSSVSVRDRGSAALLHEWKIPFLLAPDPVWVLESTPVEGLWDLPAPRVAVNLRSHRLLTPERLNVLTRALIDFQKATQVCVLLVPFQASQDLAIAQAIQPQLPGESRILLLDDPQVLKGVFRGVEMAIAMRLHGVIMAAAEGCRCFALSYDPKVSHLMAELELPGYELAELPEAADQISHAWLEVYANGDALSADQRQSLVDRASMHQEILRVTA